MADAGNQIKKGANLDIIGGAFTGAEHDSFKKTKDLFARGDYATIGKVMQRFGGTVGVIGVGETFNQYQDLNHKRGLRGWDANWRSTLYTATSFGSTYVFGAIGASYGGAATAESGPGSGAGAVLGGIFGGVYGYHFADVVVQGMARVGL